GDAAEVQAEGRIEHRTIRRRSHDDRVLDGLVLQDLIEVRVEELVGASSDRGFAALRGDLGTDEGPRGRGGAVDDRDLRVTCLLDEVCDLRQRRDARRAWV